MTKFIYPVYNYYDGSTYIEVVVANSVEDAKDKVIQRYFDMYDDLESDNWEDFLIELDSKLSILIGDLYDIETL